MTIFNKNRGLALPSRTRPTSIHNLALAVLGLGLNFSSSSLAADTPVNGSPLPDFVITADAALTPDEAMNLESWSGDRTRSIAETAADGPLFLALFGDSVSLATMADAKFGTPGPRFFADFFRSISSALLYESTIGRLKPTPTEESQHLLLGKLFGNMARPNLSPYLGTQEYSLATLLKSTTGFVPKVYNGAQMAGSYYFSHLYLEKFAQFFTKNPFHKKPDLIIINFNAMDFIDGRSIEVYAASVRSFYQRLTHLAPNSSLIITAMADPVPLLTAPDRVAVQHGPTGPIKCSDLYKMVRFGNTTGLYPGAPEAIINAAHQRLAAYRNILETEVRLMNFDRTLYAHYHGTVTYVPAVEDSGESINHLAADCIHPDVSIQRAIGLRMWDVVRQAL